MTTLLAYLARALAAVAAELGLPQDERDAGPFVAGMVWALGIYCLLLLGVSWLTARIQGWPL